MPDEESTSAKQSSAELSADLKLAVLEYLRASISSWLRLFGFASLGAVLITLVGGVYWMFFVLPGRAVDAAKEQLQADIAAISGKLTERLTSQLEESGAIQERLKGLNADVAAAKARILEISNADEDTLVQAGRLADLLNDSPDLDAALSTLNALQGSRLGFRNVIVIDTITSSDANAQALHAS